MSAFHTTWMSAFHNYPNVCIPRTPKCLLSTHTQELPFHTTWMAAFHAYPNVYIPRIHESLHSSHARMYVYPSVCIPRLPEYLHSTYTRVPAFLAFPNVCILECLIFHAYPNVFIPRLSLSECLHTTHSRMSAFYTYPNVCIPRIPECLNSTQTCMLDIAFFSVRLTVSF